jgi:hypothetical protein
MNPLIIIAVLFCGLSTAPIYAAGPELKEVEQLRWVEMADPIVDAKAAIERKDFALLGVRGYTWRIPGVEESKKLEYSEKYGKRLIEGTDDVVLGPEHQRLIQLATKYAEKYNRYVLSYATQR